MCYFVFVIVRIDIRFLIVVVNFIYERIGFFFCVLFWLIDNSGGYKRGIIVDIGYFFFFEMFVVIIYVWIIKENMILLK